MPGKRVQFDDETWEAIEATIRDSGSNFQELADEAFADLLKKRKRPVGLMESLKRVSARRRRKRSENAREIRARNHVGFGARRSQSGVVCSAVGRGLLHGASRSDSIQWTRRQGTLHGELHRRPDADAAVEAAHVQKAPRLVRGA